MSRPLIAVALLSPIACSLFASPEPSARRQSATKLTASNSKENDAVADETERTPVVAAKPSAAPTVSATPARAPSGTATATTSTAAAPSAKSSAPATFPGRALVAPGPARVEWNGVTVSCNATCPAGQVCTGPGTCEDHEICSANTCICDASKGWGRCPNSSHCYQLLTDAFNCGSCENRCPAGQTCTQGHCGALKCGPGETVCGNHCTDLMTDNWACGRCFHECPGKLSCVRGSCVP